MGSWERGTWHWQVPKWQCGYLGSKSVRSFGIGGALRTPSSFSWTPSWITPVSIAVAFPLNYELGSFTNFCSHSGHSTYPRAERTPTRRRESYSVLLAVLFLSSFPYKDLSCQKCPFCPHEDIFLSFSSNIKNVMMNLWPYVSHFCSKLQLSGTTMLYDCYARISPRQKLIKNLKFLLVAWQYH